MISCRQLQQTEAHEATLTGKIDAEYEEALTLTQGHSKEIAEKFYIKKNMNVAAVKATIVHEQLHGKFEIPVISKSSDEAYRPGFHILCSR